MFATILINGKEVQVNLSAPLDISIALREGRENMNAFYLPPMERNPFRMGSFIGDVNQGGACNVFSITFNPHGNGTHTECVGHISSESYSIHQCLKQFFFFAELISIVPEKKSGDRMITKELLKNALGDKRADALVIRTIPNSPEKQVMQYSGTNPAYLTEEAATWIREQKFLHLLIDVPSVDKEDDGGKLLAHRSFWNYPDAARREATITELIYVPESVPDGSFLLNLQIASFVNDASPSKPLLFRFIEGK